MPHLSSAPVGSGLFPNGARRFSSVQRAALAALIAAVEHGTGCAALTGEAGAGKTAVLDAATSLLSHPPVQVIRVAGGDASLSSKRLIAQIMGSETDDQAADAIEHVLERLLAPASLWTRTILIVDDAHALERDALAYLQLTCGLQAPDVARLQILFAGRPEFWSLLESEQLRSLRERIRVRPILPRATPLWLVDPPDPGSDAAVTPPTTALLTLPQRGALREVPAPARRRFRTRYAMASGIAATVVIVSIGPLTRERPASELPIITAGYAAPVETVADPRGAPPMRRVSAGPAAPALTHAVSLAPAMAIQIAAAAPEAIATGGAPADSTIGSPPAAGALPAPQADATGSPAAATPGPAAAPRAAPPASSHATVGAPADTTPASPMTAGTPVVPQPDATTVPPAATPAPPMTAGAPPAASSPASSAAATTSGAPARPSAPPAAVSAWQGAGTSPGTTNATETVTAVAHTEPSRATGNAAVPPTGTGNQSSPPAVPAHPVVTEAAMPGGTSPPAGKVAGLMPPSKPAVAATPPPAPVPQPTAVLPPAMVASLLRHGNERLRIGDIAAARLLFQRAAEAGSAAAAIALGKTNDPRFLAETGAQGIAPDPVAAADWYRRAAALGDRDADRLLDGLGASAAH